MRSRISSIILLFATFSIHLIAGDGVIDSTFGINGFITSSVWGDEDNGQAVALQTDGKIVVVGYSSNGSN